MLGFIKEHNRVALEENCERTLIAERSTISRMPYLTLSLKNLTQAFIAPIRTGSGMNIGTKEFQYILEEMDELKLPHMAVELRHY